MSKKERRGGLRNPPGGRPRIKDKIVIVPVPIRQSRVDAVGGIDAAKELCIKALYQ